MYQPDKTGATRQRALGNQPCSRLLPNDNAIQSVQPGNFLTNTTINIWTGIRSDVNITDSDICHPLSIIHRAFMVSQILPAALRRATFASVPDTPKSRQHLAPSSKSPVPPYETPSQPRHALRGDCWLPGGACKYVQPCSLRRFGSCGSLLTSLFLERDEEDPGGRPNHLDTHSGFTETNTMQQQLKTRPSRRCTLQWPSSSSSCFSWQPSSRVISCRRGRSRLSTKPLCLFLLVRMLLPHLLVPYSH